MVINRSGWHLRPFYVANQYLKISYDYFVKMRNIFLTSGTNIMLGWCGNMVSLGVVAFVPVMEQAMRLLRPLVFRTDSLKST